MRQVANAVMGYLCAVVAGLLIVVANPGVVVAQEVSPEARERLDLAFEQVLRDPTDLDKTYDYAKLATELGDYEAAITSYERLLLYNPNLPRVQAELGVLYYRLGSMDTAKAYFERAIANPDTPDTVRQRVEGFLAQIREGTERHFFSGTASAGVRYQTNANYGPNGDILFADAVATPDEETAEDDDFNVFASLSGRYLFDIGNDLGDFFAANVSYYGARQFEFSELDVDHLRLVAGPGYRIYPIDSGPVLFRPTVRMTYVRLDDETYNFSFGGGLDLTWQVEDNLSIFANTFAEDRQYYNTDERPNADTQNGAAVRTTPGATYLIDQDTAFTGRLVLGRVFASDDSEGYRELGASATLATRVESPFAGSEGFADLAAPWSLSLNARYAYRRHDAPNPVVSVDTREDDDISVDGTLAVPLAGGWSVFTTLGYQHNGSNLPNNEFQNFSAALGANIRF